MASCCIGKNASFKLFLFREVNRKSCDKCRVKIAQNEECQRQVYSKTSFGIRGQGQN